MAVFLTVPTPSVITDNIGGSVSRDDLESAYNGGSPCGSGACLVFLECDDGSLSQIELCFSTALQQIQCPADVTSAESRCADGDISIAAFSQDAQYEDRDLRL
jgi:ribonuclease I